MKIQPRIKIQYPMKNQCKYILRIRIFQFFEEVF